MKIRFGVMGCANIARRYVINAIKSSPNCEMVVIASRTREKAEEFGVMFQCDAVLGYEELLKREDIEAIYMPLPTGIHEEWMLKTIAAGKHILIEKSFAPNFQSAHRIASAAMQAELVIMENFMFEYHSQQIKIRNIIESGELGEIRVFKSSFGFPPLPENNFRYNKELGGGSLLDCGSYPLKACQLFFGPNVNVAHAFLHYEKALDVDIFGSVMLMLNHNNKKIPAEISFGMDNYYQCNYEFWCSKGKLVATRVYTAAPDFMPHIIIEKQNETHEYTLASDNHFVNILNRFVNQIQNGNYKTEIIKMLNQAKLIDDVRKSAIKI